MTQQKSALHRGMAGVTGSVILGTRGQQRPSHLTVASFRITEASLPISQVAGEMHWEPGTR